MFIPGGIGTVVSTMQRTIPEAHSFALSTKQANSVEVQHTVTQPSIANSPKKLPHEIDPKAATRRATAGA